MKSFKSFKTTLEDTNGATADFVSDADTPFSGTDALVSENVALVCGTVPRTGFG